MNPGRLLPGRRGVRGQATLALLAVLLPAMALPIRAQETAPSGSGRMLPLWEFGIGVGGLRLPDYRGSDQSRNWLLPLPYVVYRGEWLRADREGARAVLLDTDVTELDLSVAASVPTRSRDNLARAGMPDLKPAVEFGPDLKVDLWRQGRHKLELRLPLRAAFTVERSPRSAGTTFAPNLNLDVNALAGGWNLGLLTGPLFGDRRYHQRVYGVEPAYATATRPAYDAGGGYSGWQTLAALSRRFDGFWVGAFVRHDRLRGAAFEGSPLLRRDNAWTMGLGVSWVFANSTELVPARD